MIYAIAALSLVALACCVVLFRRREPKGWFAGPRLNGKNVGNVTCDPTGSFDFPTSEPGVHYVTKACGSLANVKQLRLRYRIEGDGFRGAKDHLPVTKGPYLYFQRRGDDWSGRGKFEAFRWWASFAPGDLTPGEHEIIVSMSANWTAVATSSAWTAPEAFQDALQNAGRLGFTFPNHEGLGHGTYADGPARFTLISLTQE